jgi:Ku protein
MALLAKWAPMKLRCSWTGYLKLSLVTVPVRVYTAISTTEKIAFNQLHKNCHQRIRQKLVCPLHGEVAREDLVKGYEYAPDKFVILSESELEAVRLARKSHNWIEQRSGESVRRLEITQPNESATHRFFEDRL